MASIPCALVVLLICLSQDHMGVQGGTVVLSSVGGNATLHCSNVVYPNCSSTVWDEWWSGVELILHGKMNPDVDTHRAKRLSLLSGCSLHITDVTPEDAGHYSCEQYLREGGPLHGESAYVSLLVLKVSASPSQTEMEADSNVTLRCILHVPLWYRGGYSLSWVDETGKELQNSTIHQTHLTSSITLTEELRGPNPVHTWTCQLTEGGQVQTSVSHTIRVKGLGDFKTSTSAPSSGPERTTSGATPDGYSSPHSSGLGDFKTSTSAPSSSPESTTSGTSSDGYSSPHSSVVHVAVRVATTISLFVAVIIVAVIYRIRSGDPHGEPNTSARRVPSAATSDSL